MLHAYKFSNNSYDLSGNSRDGIEGNIIYNSDGAYFNGVNATINVTNVGFNMTSNNFTVSIKLKTGYLGLQYPIDILGTQSRAFAILINNGLIQANNVFTDGFYCNTKNVGDNNYHSITITHNTNNFSQIYIDGSFCINGTYETKVNPTDQIRISDNSYGVNYFNGSIDYLYIYNRTLTPEEISLLNSQGNFTTNKEGEVNSSLYLNGNDYILVANNSFSATNKYSICTFLKTNFLSSSKIYFSSRGDYMSNNVGQAYQQSGSLLANTYFNDNVYNHVCFTADGTTKSVYINGALDNSVSNGASIDITHPFTIGAYYNYSYVYYPQYNWLGSIDEFMIYNYALSSAEVSTIYNGYNSNIQLYFYSANSGLPIIDQITVKINNGSNEQTYITTAGNQFINNLNQGTYTLNIYSDTYLPRSQIITVGNHTSQTLNIFLINTTVGENVIFTVKNKNQLYAIANSLINLYSYQNGSYYLTESKYSDISGKAQFSYLPNTNYKFVVSASGYQTYTFILDPIIFDTYDIYLDVNSSIPAEFDKDDLYIYYTPKIFYNGTTTNFSYTISAPLSNLVSYFYTITTPIGSTTYSGSNAMGETHSSNINVNNASVNPTYFDTVRLLYGYTTSNGTSRNFTDLLDIGFLTIPPIPGSNASNNTFMNLDKNTYGMGIFERILIMSIIIIFCVGISMLIGQVLPGLVLGLMVMGYLVFIGFIPIWAVIISILLGFFYLIWKSGGY
jgi:hypothetical protein